VAGHQHVWLVLVAADTAQAGSPLPIQVVLMKLSDLSPLCMTNADRRAMQASLSCSMLMSPAPCLCIVVTTYLLASCIASAS
jgi:hypothetical protein